MGENDKVRGEGIASDPSWSRGSDWFDDVFSLRLWTSIFQPEFEAHKGSWAIHFRIVHR